MGPRSGLLIASATVPIAAAFLIIVPVVPIRAEKVTCLAFGATIPSAYSSVTYFAAGFGGAAIENFGHQWTYQFRMSSCASINYVP